MAQDKNRRFGEELLDEEYELGIKRGGFQRHYLAKKLCDQDRWPFHRQRKGRFLRRKGAGNWSDPEWGRGAGRGG